MSSWYEANVFNKDPLITDEDYDAGWDGYRKSGWFEGACVASGRKVKRYENEEAYKLIYLYEDTKELFTGVLNYFINSKRNISLTLKDGKHHCVGSPAYVEIGGNGSADFYYLDGRSYGSDVHLNMKSYWKHCWDEYRTEENEKMLMAKLLAAK